ncbi:MAG: hydantoinase/oxoprolinase N-terminal domain-containing protein [Alphaproteobacteria bacterium]
MSYRITVDTGGTFTDMVVTSDSGQQVIGKAPTTPARIFNGMRAHSNRRLGNSA